MRSDKTTKIISSVISRTGGLLLLLFFLAVDLRGQSAGFTSEDIFFESAGALLAGTVHTPPDAQAAVVLVHGSGQAPRMVDIAHRMAERGIAVLTYDKRGVGSSGGVYAGPEEGTNNVDSGNLELLAQDASAAISELHARVGEIPVGLAGISQAGWIIPLAANKNPLTDFMVMFCGPVVTTMDQLIFQQFTDGDEDFWDTRTEQQVREYIPMGREYFRGHPELSRFVSTDPTEALGEISIPGIWLLGERDIQIPVRLSIENLNALKTAGKPYEYCLFPALGHNVVYGGSDQPFEIAVQWIKQRKSSKGDGGEILETIKKQADRIYNKLIGDATEL